MSRGRPTELFPTDDPLTEGQMIGRGEDVDELVARLVDVGQNVVLIDPRRTGKTTICRAALARAEAAGCYVAALDLFRLSRVGQIADALVEETIQNRPALRRALHTARASGRSFLESLTISTTARAESGVEGLEISLLPHLRTDPERYLSYALELPQKIAAADNRRLVLFIDEFQDVVRIGDSDYPGGAIALTRRMRAVFQDCPDVVFLFAGSIERMMRDLFADPDEAFFNFGSIITLSPILPDEWREGLRERFAAGETTIDDASLDRLIELGGTHPRTTMLLAQQAYLGAVLGQTRTITGPLVDGAWLEAMRSERKRHEATLEHIQTLGGSAVRRNALLVARAVAAGHDAGAAIAPGWAINRTLKALRDAGIVEGQGRGRARIIDPLFAAYLRELPLPINAA